MSMPEIRVFQNLEELSQAAAARFAEITAQPRSDNRPFSIALSGGHTPKHLYELLATQEFSSRIPWSNVHLFQVDERCVPPTSTESNYRMIREAMLDKIPLPSGHFHRMTAEQPDRDAAARSYARELQTIAAESSAKWPRLDLIFLGLGEDGHTASLFPSSAALEEEKLAVCPNWIEKLGMWRLTLTYPVLNAAARIIFLVAGAEKAKIVRRILRSPQGTPLYPAQRVKPSNGTVTWFLDEAAAQFL